MKIITTFILSSVLGVCAFADMPTYNRIDAVMCGDMDKGVRVCLAESQKKVTYVMLAKKGSKAAPIYVRVKGKRIKGAIEAGTVYKGTFAQRVGQSLSFEEVELKLVVGSIGDSRLSGALYLNGEQKGTLKLELMMKTM